MDEREIDRDRRDIGREKERDREKKNTQTFHRKKERENGRETYSVCVKMAMRGK